MKLTKWIHGNIKPVRAGVYQRKYGYGFVSYCYWDGDFWYWREETPALAEACGDRLSSVQTLPWRGLAEKPE